MSYIHTDDRTRWTEDLTVINAQIAALVEIVMSGPISSGIKSYSYNAGTGDVMQKFESGQTIISTLSKLRAERERYVRLLRGTALQRTQTRR